MYKKDMDVKYYYKKYYSYGFRMKLVSVSKVLYISNVGRYRLTGDKRFAICGIDALAEVFCRYFYFFEEAASTGAAAVFELALICLYGGKFLFPDI